jgi:hypothetical protein
VKCHQRFDRQVGDVKRRRFLTLLAFHGITRLKAERNSLGNHRIDGRIKENLSSAKKAETSPPDSGLKLQGSGVSFNFQRTNLTLAASANSRPSLFAPFGKPSAPDWPTSCLASPFLAG